MDSVRTINVIGLIAIAAATIIGNANANGKLIRSV